MIELDKTKIYDLLELNNEELQQVLDFIRTEDRDWSEVTLESFSNGLENVGLTYGGNEWVWVYDKPTTNAKELFYTLDSIQVDCSELTEGQVKEMCKVYENNGYKQWIDEDALKIENGFTYLRTDWANEFYINGESGTKTTITYEKFMELFAEKEEACEAVPPSGWYKDGNFCMYHDFETDEKYGFCHDGSWANVGILKASEGFMGTCTLISKEEVEERLKEEAIKRGFVGNMNYDHVYNEFWNNSTVILKDGVWSESPQEEAPLNKPSEGSVTFTAVEGLKGNFEIDITPQAIIKHLTEKDIFLTPKQYKKLWKGL